MQFYAITNSASLASTLTQRIEALCRLASGWAESGVEYLQIREKDLTPGELEKLSRRIIDRVRGGRTRVLVNGRADVALAAGAHGVHLPGGEQLLPSEVRRLFHENGEAEPVVSISCHSLEEAMAAQADGVSVILFGPIFGKQIKGGELQGVGLAALSKVCAA